MLSFLSIGEVGLPFSSSVFNFLGLNESLPVSSSIDSLFAPFDLLNDAYDVYFFLGEYGRVDSIASLNIIPVLSEVILAEPWSGLSL